MEYYRCLYTGESIQKNLKQVIRKLELGKTLLDIHIIVLSKNEKNHLETFDSALLFQKVLKKEDLFVVGIARGHDEAILLIEEIVKEVYDKTKGTDIRGYIINKQNEGN